MNNGEPNGPDLAEFKSLFEFRFSSFGKI